MDDGSTDQTLSILESYGARITVLRQPNKGVGSARNELCGIAQGELIAFLDSDDLLASPISLKLSLASLPNIPNAAGFFTGHRDIQGYCNCEWDSVASEF